MPEQMPSLLGMGTDASPVLLERSRDVSLLEGEQTPIARRPGVGQRLLHNPIGLVSLTLLLLVHVLVFLGPVLWPISPNATDALSPLSGPSSAHLLGTDDLGRDELSRLLHGGQITLIVGVVSMTVLISLGTVIGAAAAYAEGWIDTLLMRFTDAMMAIPSFFFVLVALTVLPKTVLVISVVIASASWMQVTRVVYGDTLRWKTAEFVEAARAMGISPLRIMTRHILPQIYPAIIVSATLGIAFAILTESAISYLGLGIQPPTPSWGNMLESAQAYVWTAPNLALFPGIAISVAVLAYNTLGDALRDVLDPRLTR